MSSTDRVVRRPSHADAFTVAALRAHFPLSMPDALPEPFGDLGPAPTDEPWRNTPLKTWCCDAPLNSSVVVHSHESSSTHASLEGCVNRNPYVSWMAPLSA